jgi:hypothetical protein
MNLQEIKLRYYGLSQVWRTIVDGIETPAKLASQMGLDPTKPLAQVTMSFTRVIASHPFVAVQEDLVTTPKGAAILNIAVGRSHPIKNPQQPSSSGAECAVVFDHPEKVHSYASETGQLGLPPSSLLRSTGEDFKIHMAKLTIEVVQGEGDEQKKVTKNKYYGADFILQRSLTEPAETVVVPAK